MITSNQEVLIQCPIAYCMQLFKDQNNFRHWQKGLISFKNESGVPGSVNSTRSMIIKTGGIKIKMKEKITLVDLPHKWEATYTTKGITNYQKNRFTATAINGVAATKWESFCEFKFSGMMKLVARTHPDIFKAQTLQHMKDFKTFAEELYKNDEPTIKTHLGF